MQIRSACTCHIGKRRRNNEDNFYFDGIVLSQNNNGLSDIITSTSEDKILVGVFDGMGGEADGEIASYIAAQTLKEENCNIQDSDSMAKVLYKANRRICKIHTDSYAISGSTALIIHIYNSQAEITNLGDSKGYILRDGKLKQISTDHTDAEVLKTLGVTRKPRLTQHLGIPESEFKIEPSIVKLDIKSGDLFLLSTDGLTDMLSNSEIENILKSGDTIKDKVKELLDKSLDNGGKDNITIILIEIA